MERDGAVFGVSACAELVAGVVGKAGGAAQRVTGAYEPAGGVVLVALAGPIRSSDCQQLPDGVVCVLRSVISTFSFIVLPPKLHVRWRKAVNQILAYRACRTP